MMRGLRFARLWLAFFLLTATSAFGLAAETITVRGGVHPDFARIVFDTPPEAPFTVQAEKDAVVVRFQVGAEYDLSAAQKALFRYIGAATVSAEGREVRFPFKREFDVRSARIDGKVVVDLYAQKAADRRVRVRAGEHPTYSRIVFDWDKPVAARLEQSEGEATIVFDQAAEFGLERVQRNLPAGITRVSVPKSDKGSRVAIQASENSTFRLFRDGNKAVLDVTRPTQKQAAEANKAEPEQTEGKSLVNTAAPKATASAEKPEDPKASAVDKPTSLLPQKPQVDSTGPAGVAPDASAAQGNAPTPSAATNQATATKDADANPLEQEDKKAVNRPARQETAAEARLAKGVVRFATPESIRAAAAAQRAGAPIPEDNLVTLDAFRTELNVEAALAQGQDVGGDAGLVMLADDPDLPLLTPAPGKAPEPIEPTVLKFGWDRETGAAAFQRGNRLWLVFDRLGPFDLTRQLRRIAPHLEPIDRVPVQGGTAVRLTLPPLFAPRLAFDDNVWTVDIRRRVPLPEDAVSVSVTTGAKGPEVVFTRGDARTLLSIADPDLNDRIIVAPVRQPGLGVASVQQFAQFRALVSYQGVVLQPTAEGLAMSLEKRGVVVSGREPLQVSGSDARALPSTGERNPLAGGSMFDLEQARRGGDEEFTANKQELQRDVVRRDANKVGIARLDLARFYFGHGRAPEALGMLRLLDAENPALATDPEVVMMKGASQFLTDNFDEAARNLAHPALVGEREAVLWQSALAAKDQDWEAAATGFAETDDLIDQYARPVRTRLRLLEAEASLATGDTGGASLQLRKIEADEPTEAELAQVGYLRGRRLLLDGEEEEAEKLWKQIARNRHRPSSARARLALVDMGLNKETITDTEAIDELENLRFAWRGDKFEFALLRRLGDLYLAGGDYRQGLKSMRQAASHFPSSKRSEEVTRRMQQEFKDLYLSEKGQDVQAVTAVALYEEYKELTPPGEEGDAIITKLADRLVEVDLLERAGDLLEDQVTYRLKGEEKAKVAARAALIRLLERKPEDALRLLAESESDELPGGLVQQRRHLQARALAEAEREDEALALLEGDTASDALQLRAEILWKQRNWKDAGLALARLVPAEPPKRELSNKEALAVLNLAVALTLADDRPALELLAESYRDPMDETPQAESFALLSGDLIGNDVKSITEELAQIGQIQDFVTSYRQQLNSTQLSELE
ncbi:hypothetical protein [Denitrobaculum tricleocarpae]|uniref:Tetratricopeptide repeat protein n=1 Tax=Denitrobaculum tricleocarpae TaxID=2591009 RepID=A0A545T235_9PROT|nr:hypothetical protein [Denitrobaculum tricleocarpae]TQV71266.1 hypothetical protein FKG95_26900 [Denitrobaculum tricleocarpae]